MPRMGPSDSDLPSRKGRTGNFRRGQPRSAAVFGGPGDWRVRYLASSGPEDPLLALVELDRSGGTAVLADPAQLLAADEDLPPAEQARRERLREGGAGITGFSSDRTGHRSAFTLSGQLWLAGGSAAQRLTTGAAVVDPRISPDGSRVAYVGGRDLRVVEVASGADSALCPSRTASQSWGLAEFIAAEEMGRYRGFWWSPDSQRLLVAEVDEDGVDLWWIGDPSQPAAEPRAMRYPAAGTPNAAVRLWLVELDGRRREVQWDREAFPYLAAVHWDEPAALISVQSRDQQRVCHLVLGPGGASTVAGVHEHRPWVELVPGSPRLAPDGAIVSVAADPDTDSWRVRRDNQWLTEPGLYVRALHRCDDSGIWISATPHADANHLYLLDDSGCRALTQGRAWHTVLAAGAVPVIASPQPKAWQPVITVGDPAAPQATLPNRAEAPAGDPRIVHLPSDGPVRVAAVLPDMLGPAPVIVSSYGGPHAQRAVRANLSLATEQWLADNGFAVVTIDGRGAPGVSPSCEAAIHGDLATAPLADQVEGLHRASEALPGRLDLSRVGIRGWSFGGYLAALAVLERPDVFHAAFAGAPVTEWRLYDTNYTERYLGQPQDAADRYDASSLLPRAADLQRPLTLVHGIADDNVVVAHTLRLSSALMAHGQPHDVLPLPGISHMTPQEAVTEQLLRLELDFFQRHLGAAG